MRNLKRALSLALASVMLLGMMVVGSSAASYPDVDDNDNVEAIEVLNAVKVMIGDHGSFNPDKAVNRHEMAVIMAKLVLGNEAADNYVGSHPFTDVYPWADKYVAACYENGLVSGTSATTYGGNQPLTAVQAAAMMLRALGYKDLSKGATDWRAPVTAMANQIRLFSGVASNPKEQLTRNQVAQLALNTLKSPVVDLKDGTFNISDGNGAVIVTGGSREYIVRSSNEAYARAINNTERAGTSASSVQGYTVELGEHLYNGDLKLYDDRTDDFGRPARVWEYDGKDIGSYAKYELLRAEYTIGVTGRELYELLGKSTIENNEVEYYLNGKTDTTIEPKTMVKANTNTYSTTGKGVLTQVFFEAGTRDADGEITIVSIDTFLAKATGDYNEKKESLSVDIWAKDTLAADVGADTEIKLDEVAAIEGMKKDDKFLVQVAWDGKKFEIINVMNVESLSDVKLNKYAANDYLANANDQYDYAKSGKLANSLNEIAAYGTKALVDYTYDLYFDQYGYLIGNAVHSGEKHYVFIAGYDLDGSHLATAEAKASAIFLDGTMQNIQVNVKDTNTNINDYNTSTKTAGTSAYWYPELGKSESNTGGLSQYNAWFTYTTDSKTGVYTLTPAKNWMDVEATSSEQKINTASMRLTQFAGLKGADSNNAGAAGTRAYGNDDSVYITVNTGDVSKGAGHKGITEITGVYTGVQNVDLKIWKTGTNDNENQLDAKDASTHASTNTATDWGWNSNARKSGVFAVYNDDLYIIGAVVVGEDNTNTNNYAYILKQINKEYIDADNNHYWDFEAVVDGKVETLTAKISTSKYGSFSSTFNSLCGAGKNGLAQVTYDKDNYVTGLSQMNDANTTDKVYGLTDYTVEIDPDTHKVYSVKYDNTTAVANQPKKGSFTEIGRSLYNDGTINGSGTDAGLPLNTGAPVIVVRQNNYSSGSTELVYDDYSTIEQALNALDTHKTSFEGWVSAVLDDKGAAKFIVINDKTPYVITDDDGPSGSQVGDALVWSNDDGSVNITATEIPDPEAIADLVRGTRSESGIASVTYDANAKTATIKYANGKTDVTVPVTLNKVTVKLLAAAKWMQDVQAKIDAANGTYGEISFAANTMTTYSSDSYVYLSNKMGFAVGTASQATSDFANYLVALKEDGATKIAYGGKDYTWDSADTALACKWKNGSDTLVSTVVTKMGTDLGVSSMSGSGNTKTARIFLNVTDKDGVVHPMSFVITVVDTGKPSVT